MKEFKIKIGNVRVKSEYKRPKYNCQVCDDTGRILKLGSILNDYDFCPLCNPAKKLTGLENIVLNKALRNIVRKT